MQFLLLQQKLQLLLGFSTQRACVFVCVSCTDSGVGTIYVSDDRGAVFSKSLERHLYTTTGSDTDFTAITSLRGVYMTSVLTVGESTLCVWRWGWGVLLPNTIELTAKHMTEFRLFLMYSNIKEQKHHLVFAKFKYICTIAHTPKLFHHA